MKRLKTIPAIIRIVVIIIIAVAAWVVFSNFLKGCDDGQIATILEENKALMVEREVLKSDIAKLKRESDIWESSANRFSLVRDSLEQVLVRIRTVNITVADTTYTGSEDDLSRELDSLFVARIGVNAPRIVVTGAGYMFSRPAAIDYRNTVVVTLPQQEVKLKAQADIIAACKLEAGALRSQVSVLSERGALQESALSVCEREISNHVEIGRIMQRQVKRERITRNLVIAGAVAVIVVVATSK